MILETVDLRIFAPLFFIAAALYTGVGHGGASAYLALFALAGLASPSTAAVALMLNVAAASISFLHYRAAGHFSMRLLLPFAASSVPASFIGGMIPVSPTLFSFLLGGSLVIAAVRICWNPGGQSEEARMPERIALYGAGMGVVLGLLSGMIGIGGGIFLSPILLLFRWADVKRTAAISSAFIVLNSLSGLGGHALRGSIDPEPAALILAVAVLLGAIAGSRISVRRLRARELRYALGLVLLFASVKLLWGGVSLLGR